MKNTIIEAIENRNILEFDYDGCHRKVEPHTLGVSTRDNEILSAFQIGGQSNTIDIPDWGLFSLNKIQRIRIVDETFKGTRNGYTRGDSRMKRIFAEL